MPFQSDKQRRYLWANEPEIARDWTNRYGAANGGGILQLVKSGPGRPGYNGQGDTGTYGKAGQSYGDRERYTSVDVKGPPNIHGGTTRTIGPTTPKDTFEQSWTGPKGWFGGGGYKTLKTPGDTSGGHKSRFGIGNLFRGAMSIFGGIPGKIGSMLSHINPNQYRENLTGYKTQQEYEDARTKRQTKSRIDRLRKTRDYGKYANDPEGWAASDLSGRLTGFEKDVFGKDYVDYSRTTPKARDLKALRDQQALTSQLSANNYDWNKRIATHSGMHPYHSVTTPAGWAMMENAGIENTNAARDFPLKGTFDKDAWEYNQPEEWQTQDFPVRQDFLPQEKMTSSITQTGKPMINDEWRWNRW